MLTDLDNFKLPALTQAGFEVSGADIVLASKSGFSESDAELASGRAHVRSLHADELLADL